MKSEILYLITGHPGSGKTTRAKELMAKENITHHYEADMKMCDEEGNYRFDFKRLGYCHNWCKESTENAMILGESVIVSNTTTTKKEARDYIALAKKYGYDVVIEHLNADYESIHGVPPDVLAKMKARREFFKVEDFD